MQIQISKSVGIGSTFDTENGKYESGVLVVVLKDEEGTTTSVKLAAPGRKKHEKLYEKMLAMYKGDRHALNKAIKELDK